MIDEHIASAELWLTSTEGDMKVTFHWKEKPSVHVLDECFIFAKSLKQPLLNIITQLWGTDIHNIIVSSPERVESPGGNYFGAELKWELGASTLSYWKAINIIISLREPFMLRPLGPHRFDIFIVPYTDYHGFDYRPPSRTKKSCALINERLQLCKSALSELLSRIHGNRRAAVELGEPRWEKECVTYRGDDAFRIAGVVRYTEDEETIKNELRNSMWDYDIALSFAGEDRSYAEELANILRSRAVKIFYDRYEQAHLWGKDLYQHLQSVYRDKARYCVVFISSAYVEKLWTKHELRQAQERAFNDNHEYILPLRLDDTELPGVNRTIGFIDLRYTALSEVAEMLIRKLKEP